MDECIGRLVANIGVDRTATGKAVRIVEHWSSAARTGRCVRSSWINSSLTLRKLRGTRNVCALGGNRVRFGGNVPSNARPMTAMARIGAAAASAGEVNDHSQEQAGASAAGEIAGAILGLSQQI